MEKYKKINKVQIDKKFCMNITYEMGRLYRYKK